MLTGDFRQTLPVVPRGTPADTIKACVKNSNFCPNVHVMHMKTNMRVALYGDAEAESFLKTLEAIGNDKLKKCADGSIDLKKNKIGIHVDGIQELICKVYQDLTQDYKNAKWLVERAILSPRNYMVDQINEYLIKELPGTLQCYHSFDTTLSEDQAIENPTEFLNSLELAGVPPHLLSLKEGAPIMLLRNLDPPHLCNRTRLIVKQMMPNLIEATIMTGHSRGKDVFIPRIPIIPSDIPVEFKRVQFPLHL